MTIQGTVLRCLLVLGLMLPVPDVLAKGRTIRIEVGGDGMATPFHITDAALVDAFSIWNGPGVSTTTKGIENPPSYLQSDANDGRFIDWPRGYALDKPGGLQRFEITFELEFPTGNRYYVFAFEFDRSSRQGYVFLPEWNNDLIWHFREGRWLYATRDWTESISPVIEQHMKLHMTSVGETTDSFRCTAGTALLKDDGTIVLQRDPDRNSGFEYQPSTPEYDRVWQHIDGLERGVPKDVSCWPLR